MGVAYLAFSVPSSLTSEETSGVRGSLCSDCICYTIFIEGIRTVYPTFSKKGCGEGCVFEGGAYWSLHSFFLVTGPIHAEERKPRSLKLHKDQTVKSPFISDIYGCLTLRLRSNNGWLYVFLQFTNEEEGLVYVTYVEQRQKHDVYIRLKSFVRGSYQVTITLCSSFDSSLDGIQNVTEIQEIREICEKVNIS